MTPHRPPRWARGLARRLVTGPEREWVLGDLEELYGAWRREEGTVRATGRYVLWVLRSGVRPSRPATGLASEARSAFRQIRRYPRVFVGSALVLTVGLGISLLTWGIFYGSLWRGLPVSDPDRVVGIRLLDSQTREERLLSLDDLSELRAGVPAIQEIALWGTATRTLNDPEATPARIVSMETTPSIFSILELSPLHGRLLVEGDATPSSPPVAVLGYNLWASRYGGDPDMVGRTIRIDGTLTTVVGVLPEGAGMTAHEDVWRPFQAYTDPSLRGYYPLVLTSEAVGEGSLDGQLRALVRGLEESGREEWSGLEMTVRSVLSAFYGPAVGIRNRVLATAGVLLFVMAMVNVANLFLIHGHQRTRELAARRALGATRFHLMRQLAVEASVPALLGFVGAAGVASVALRWYQEASDAYGVGLVWQVFRLEGPHLLVLALACAASTIFVALAASGRELSTGSATGLFQGRGVTGRRFRLGQAFLGVEIAVGCALLLVVGLMVRSGWNLRTVDFGFATESVLTGDLALRGEGYVNPEARSRFWDELKRGLESEPGVLAASVGTQLPMIRCCGSNRGVELEGWAGAGPRDLPTHYANAISSDYFLTFERPVLSGRALDARDGALTEPVVLINEPFSRRYFPTGEAIGQRLRLWADGEPGPWRTIVGVAPHLWMDTDENARPEGLYVPLSQLAPRSASFAIRVSGDPLAHAPAVRELVAGLDADLALDEVRTMPQLIRNRTRLYRREGPLFVAVGAAAFALAIAGLYTVVSYMASQRMAEFGIRAAMGAERGELIRRGLSTGTVPTALGAAAGLFVGLSMVQGFDRFLFLVDPLSPWVAAGNLAVLCVSSAAAGVLPALRASRVDLSGILKADS